MRIRLTIAAVLAVFAISAPLASAESTGEFGAVEGTAEITFIKTERIVLMNVSENACLQFQRMDGLFRADCGGEDLAPLAPPVELIVGPPKGLEPGPPEVPDPPIDPGRPCGEDTCLGV